MEIHIDGKQIATEVQFHEILSKLLDFGPHYGRNLAALRDRLLTDVERPVKLIWDYSDASKQQIGDVAFGKITDILDETVKQDIDLKFAERFEYELR